MSYRRTFRAGCSLSLRNWINGKNKNDRPRLCWRPLTLTKPRVSRPILPSYRSCCGGSAILVTSRRCFRWAIMMMCSALLESRRHHQVQNQSHRTLDIEFHRQCLYQPHHRRCSLGTFLFSCAPRVQLYDPWRIPQRCGSVERIDIDAIRKLLPAKGKRPAGAAHKVLHFLQGDEAIFVGVHRLEDALLSSLPLL